MVGHTALEQAPLTLERFERTPKRVLGQGEVLLGQTLYASMTLVAHVLTRVVDEAACPFDGTRPAAVVLTHRLPGPGQGIDPLGGEDIDQHLIDHLAKGPTGAHADWSKLISPPEVTWRIHQAAPPRFNRARYRYVDMITGRLRGLGCRCSTVLAGW
jgi:hypothetical protein